MHQVCRKCGQFCPHFQANRNTLHVYCSHYCSRILFTYTVYQCSSSVDNFVHTLFKLSTLFLEEFTVHIKHCLRILQKVWTMSTLLSERVHCSRKILFTYLTESMDKLVHTFIKLSTLSGDEFYCSRLKCSYGKLFT